MNTDEIERIRLVMQLRTEREKRNRTIEECARVAESYQNERGKVYAKPEAIAVAIRGLKG